MPEGTEGGAPLSIENIFKFSKLEKGLSAAQSGGSLCSSQTMSKMPALDPPEHLGWRDGIQIMENCERFGEGRGERLLFAESVWCQACQP